MRVILIFACFLLLECTPCLAEAELGCTIQVQSEVEITSANLALADLLGSNSCPEVLRAAAQVPLGRAPLIGSVRVLEGDAVRAMLKRIAPTEDCCSMLVPERIRVRRAGDRAECPDLPVASPSAGQDQKVECGAAGRISRDASLLLNKPVWDSFLRRWQAVARCTRPSDCVPFLVQLSGTEPILEIAPAPIPTRQANALASSRGQRANISENIAMRPGQAATLIWEQDGIRVTGRAVCLDRGNPGDSVRARISPGGRVIPTIVVRSGLLRAAHEDHTER